MTMLAPHMRPEASIPSLENCSFVVLGGAMDSIVKRVIETKSHFADSLRCSFWHQVVEAENPELFNENAIRVVTLEPSAVRFAAQCSSYSSRLEPTRLLDFEI